ncbi:hypothetical protein BGX23_000697 [Mortierella sp. AD031]|nr:hypothetical protein BGX23_000697 [Mortierella sp. AD031]KAG0201453.1 hypothetical protein BGX33_010323 [Mortierella sp. NVP41]
MTEAPFQFQLALDALSYLVTQLERDNSDPSPNATSSTTTTTTTETGTATGPMTTDDLAKLKTCAQAFLTAAYHCLFLATKMSCTSEESCWIGSGISRAGNVRNTFMEQDWARGRLYYEAHYIFRLGLEDLLSFMKTNPSTVKLYATFDQPLKDLKSESDSSRVK